MLGFLLFWIAEAKLLSSISYKKLNGVTFIVEEERGEISTEV